jgi:hypothetical protein
MTLCLDALLLDPHPFEVWIAYRTDGITGSGTAGDPWDGSSVTKLDALLSALPANTRIHLGPSPKDIIGNVMPFQTRGYADGGTGGWQAKAGMKIVGSGIDVTVLQLVNVSPGTNNFAVGHPLGESTRADFFEIFDLTIDCNLAQVQAFDIRGAVRLMGEHVKIHRIKAINWGTQYSAHCAVFSLVTSAPDGDVQEGRPLRNRGMHCCAAID